MGVTSYAPCAAKTALREVTCKSIQRIDVCRSKHCALILLRLFWGIILQMRGSVTVPGRAENRGWPGDVVITALSRAGLPAPSVIRPAKIAAIGAANATKLRTCAAAVVRLSHCRPGW
jgi:hypothetical protein